MARRPAVPPLVGLAEIADMAKPGTRTSSVSNWRSRYPDFPGPYIEFKMGPAFLRSEVETFLRARPNLGGNFEQALSDSDRAAIRAAIASGESVVSKLAEQYGCSRGLIYKIAGDLLFED